ncbi:hypothetical protein [Rhizorhabdus argentea]|uniref:hypothetical protein n=1 Tax=Rhizorhabdus argentea TaxID=1387174 RepID=UPI0030EE2BBE
MKQLLIVLSNAHAGRDDEFNQWYSYVHVRDVMRSRSAIAVQRFVLSEAQLPGRATPEHRYLALYEADDHQGLTDGHAEVFTAAMPISNAFRFDDMREAYYEPLAARKARPGPEGDGAVIVERLALDAGDDRLVQYYCDERLARITALPGIVSGRFAVVAEHQMLPPNPDSHFIAVYRVTDLQRALMAWDAADRAAPPPFRAGASVVAAYVPLMPRLTAHASNHPDPETAQRAAAARAALGDKVYAGFPDGDGDG